ncbi:MAG: ABC transporter ATP-binding protein [Gammaproteobacteria bacterium]|nr:ABC transporter ATP-binding protein [Gammaproteobacteria bacterium]
MISMRGVNKTFRTDTVETTALKDLDLDIQAKEFVALVGPSGSGKSTFMNIAGLLENVDAGTYLFEGTDVSSMKDRERSRFRNEKIGFVFQAFNLIPELNVFDNIDVPLRYRGLGKSERRRRIEEVASKVGLIGRLKHHPSQLSGGQQQRVAIARALAGDPNLLLADEPTGNLDSAMADSVMQLLLDLHQEGSTVVMVTHDPTLANRAERQVFIKDGMIDPSAEVTQFAD